MRSRALDRRVFVDTSAYYAAVNRRDADHVGAGAMMERLTVEQRRLTTTNIILFELHGPLLNRINRQVALGTLFKRFERVTRSCACGYAMKRAPKTSSPSTSTRTSR